MAKGVGLDQSASSIEFTSTGCTEIFLSGSCSKATEDIYFTVYINGARQSKRVKFTRIDSSVLIADGLKSANTYTIKLVRETEEKYGEFYAYSLNLGYTGKLCARPADKDLYIEFIGDSITCGLGSLCGYLDKDGLTVLDNSSGSCADTSQYGTSFCEDATNSYAYLAAETLNADCNFVSKSGIGVTPTWGNKTMSEYYATKHRTRIPDLVVINLGTNDSFVSANKESYIAGVKALIGKVRAAYEQDIKIIWATGLMGDAYDTYTQTAIDALENKTNIYRFDELTKGTDGHNGHPTKEQAAVAAKELVKYITDNNILAGKEAALGKLTLNDSDVNLSDYSLVWYDGFSADSFDSSKWTQATDVSKSNILKNTVGDHNLSLKDDDAVLTVRREADGTYTKAQDLTTENRMAFKHGYLEIRAKIPFGRPMWPAFWMKSNRTIDSANAADYMTEVDIFEVMGSDTLTPNIHRWTNSEDVQANGKKGPLATDDNGKNRYTVTNTEEYHTYGFLIDNNKVAFYVDGVQYASVSTTDAFWTDGNKGFNDYFYVRLGVGIFVKDGKYFPDGDKSYAVNEGDEFPRNFEVDYIRLYQNNDGKIYYGNLPK